jgi:hypothetical protein
MAAPRWGSTSRSTHSGARLPSACVAAVANALPPSADASGRQATIVSSTRVHPALSRLAVQT